MFEIDSRFKFAVIVCKRDNDGTRSFRAGFYLHDDKLLFSEMQSDVHLLTYSREFVETTGGAHLTFVECRDPQDVQILTKCYEVAPHKFGDFADNYSIKLTQGFSLTRENDLLMPITQLSQMSLPVREGKTFFQYLDAWDTPIRYTTPLKRLIGKAHWLESVKYYRLAFRKVASATNERTVIFALLTPGSVFTDSVCCETTPQERINSNANLTAAVCNSFTFDWIARKKVGANVMFFLLRTLPFPNLDDNLRGFLTHSALRLTCNHVGYAPLWEEQLGSEWREPTPAHTFPVLASDDERWQVRAAIDAVVAQAYGLSREQYAHVLASFSHKSYPAAPTLCLQKFDELAAIGLDAFTRKYDPYWDVPLVETLPKPVIELPTLTQDTGEGRVAEERGKYAVKDLFGDTVPTNLFGEVVEKKKGRGRKK